jgi:hypothetical protein
MLTPVSLGLTSEASLFRLLLGLTVFSDSLFSRVLLHLSVTLWWGPMLALVAPEAPSESLLHSVCLRLLGVPGLTSHSLLHAPQCSGCIPRVHVFFSALAHDGLHRDSASSGVQLDV